MDTSSAKSSIAVAAVRTVSWPALVGASLGAAAALLRNGDQGDVINWMPASSNS